MVLALGQLNGRLKFILPGVDTGCCFGHTIWGVSDFNLK